MGLRIIFLSLENNRFMELLNQSIYQQFPQSNSNHSEQSTFL